jgi:glycosyltransferase Alg8
MLRNNGRAIRLGMGAQKPFVWFCLVDQRISMFTSLLGPVAAIWASFWLSWHYLVLYLAIVIFVRTIYLFLLVLEGHRLAIFDIPMLLYTQWVGSMVKIYTMFHLHKQSWDSHRTNMARDTGSNSVLVDLIPKMQIALSTMALIGAVALLVGFKK